MQRWHIAILAHSETFERTKSKLHHSNDNNKASKFYRHWKCL